MTNYSLILIIAGGLFNLAFAIYHLTFWKVFHWKEDLTHITKLNRGIVQIINLCLTFMLFFMAYISFFYCKELNSTELGNAILIGISLFWFLRMVEQILFFSIKRKISIVYTFIFLIGCLLYAVPYILTRV